MAKQTSTILSSRVDCDFPQHKPTLKARCLQLSCKADDATKAQFRIIRANPISPNMQRQYTKP